MYIQTKCRLIHTLVLLTTSSSGFVRWKGCVVIDFSAAKPGCITLVSQDKHTHTYMHTKTCGTYQYTGSIIWDISSVKDASICTTQWIESQRREMRCRDIPSSFRSMLSSSSVSWGSKRTRKAETEWNQEKERRYCRTGGITFTTGPCRFPYHSLTPVRHS